MPPETDNLQLEKLYRDDQKDREKPLTTSQAMERLLQRDQERVKKVYTMIRAQEVRTKNDLFHAGVVLYHGQDAADFLAAHRLAVMTALMGRRDARWLCAASLDRFLMKIGMSQTYGTQFEYNASSRRYELKLPMEDSSILDFEKEVMTVPMISERLKELNRNADGRTRPAGAQGPMDPISGGSAQGS